MSTLLTFLDAKNSRELANISGTCPSSEDFKSLLNQATRKLMNRGNFWGTVEKIRVCLCDGCATWPNVVGTILAVNHCRYPMPVQNNWYSFTPMSLNDWGGGGFCMSGTGAAGCCGTAIFENAGNSPVFSNIPCSEGDFYIRAYPNSLKDVGKTITVFGIDGNGQAIRTARADGTIQDGVVLTLALPFVSTSFIVRQITRILKDVTQDVVRLYQYDAVNNALWDCAVYQPYETSPSYRATKIHGARTGSACKYQIDALVKLEFIPVKVDSDLVLISNLDALALMMQSIRYSNAGDVAEARAGEADAVRELNLEIRNRVPLDQIPIRVEAFGSALPSGPARIGRIV